MVKVLIAVSILILSFTSMSGSERGYLGIILPEECEEYSGKAGFESENSVGFSPVEKCSSAGVIVYKRRSFPEENIYGDCKVVVENLHSNGTKVEVHYLLRKNVDDDCEKLLAAYLPMNKEGEDPDRLYADVWTMLSDVAGGASLHRLSFIDRHFSGEVRSFLNSIRSCQKILSCVKVKSIYREHNAYKLSVEINAELWVLSLEYYGDQVRIFDAKKTGAKNGDRPR